MLLALMLLSPIIMHTQDLVTEIMSSSDYSLRRLYEFDNEGYVIEYSKFDSINIYKIVDNNTEFLHSLYYPNSYTNRNSLVRDQYLFLQNLGQASVYNFIDNTLFDIPKDTSFDKLYWSTITNGKAILEKRDVRNDYTKNYLVDYGNSEANELLIGEKIIGVYNNYIVYENYTDQRRDYFYYDMDTDSSELIRSDNFSAHFEDNNLFYINANGFYKYNLDTKTRQNIYNFSSDISGQNFEVNDTHFLVYFGTTSDASIVMIDKEDYSYETYKAPNLINTLSPTLASDNLVFTIYNTLYFLNINTKELKQVPIWNSFLSSVTVKNDKVFYRDQSIFVFIDLSSGHFKEYKLELPVAFIVFYSYFQKDSKWYFDFYLPDQEVTVTYTIDLSNESVEEINLLDSFPYGLAVDSELFNLDGRLILFDENLYEVNGDKKIDPLNVNPLIKTEKGYFNISDNYLTWVQKDDNGIGIYKYEDGKTSLNTLIPFDMVSNDLDTFELADYSIFGDNTYFIGSKRESAILNYDKVDGQFSELENSGLNYSYFHKQDDFIYFIDDSLKVITSESEVIPVVSEFEDALYGRFSRFKDESYLVTDNFIYKLIGSNLEKIVNLTNSGFTIWREAQDYLILGLLEDYYFTYSLYDSENFIAIQTDEDQFLSHFNDEFFHITKTDGRLQKIIDMEKMRTFEFPDSLNADQFGYIIPRGDDIVFITKENFNSLNYWNVYLTDLNFSMYEKIYTFTDPGVSSTIDYVPFLKGGLLYFQNKIFFITEEYDFIEFETIIGDIDNINFVLHNDHYYFIAIDPVYGRQVFRIPFDFEGILNNITHLQTVQNIQVSPNPSVDKLMVNIDVVQPHFKYQIFNALGSQVDEGDSNNGVIDVGHLIAGTYFLTVQSNDNKIFVSKFLKVE